MSYSFMLQLDVYEEDRETAAVPIIIPSLEPDNRFLKLLSELMEQNLAPVEVIDDGSGEEYQHFFDEAKLGFRAIILKHDINRGKGCALKDAFSFVWINGQI